MRFMNPQTITKMSIEHHHHDHNHSHDHHSGCIKHNEALVPKWQAKLITAGQLGAAALQTVGLIKGALNPAAAIDLVHNITDGISWGGHATLASSNKGQKKEKLRTYTYGAISLGGGASVIDGIRSIAVTGHEYATNAVNLTASSVSMGAAALTATLAYQGIRKRGFRNIREVLKTKEDEDAKGIAIHAGSDLVTAGSALASSLPYMPSTVGGVAAIAAGSVCATYFYPKKEQTKTWFRQLQYEGRHRKERRPAAWKHAVAVGGAAIVAAGSIFAADSTRENKPMTIPQDTDRAYVTPDVPARDTAKIEEKCMTIQPGDSQWSIVRNVLDNAIDGDPTEAQVQYATNIVSDRNKVSFPDPNIIQPDDCLVVPHPKNLIALNYSNL